jgi:hypothetical protein
MKTNDVGQQIANGQTVDMVFTKFGDYGIRGATNN